MIKKLSVLVLISSALFSQNFNEFLNNALENSPYLKSSVLSISQVKEEGSALLRYENPSLELELSQFSPKNVQKDSGYRVAYSQPIRLWNVEDDKLLLSKAMDKKAKSKYLINKSELSYKLSIAYTLYAKQEKYFKLLNEELSIAKNIYYISSKRNKAGTISKGIMLQAKVDYELAQIKLESQTLSIVEEKFRLLELAGLSGEIDLNFNHIFTLSDKVTTNSSIVYYESLKDEALATLKVNSNTIEWIDLVGEYEKEPDQNIIRVGVSLPLAIFNNKSEELQIAKLEAQKSSYMIESQNSKLKLRSTKLNKQRELLISLKTKNKNTLKTQVELLEMFEIGYKIANINLLELQDIKNRVIQTKGSLIKIQTALDQNIIDTNYINGAYNE